MVICLRWHNLSEDIDDFPNWQKYIMAFFKTSCFGSKHHDFPKRTPWLSQNDSMTSLRTSWLSKNDVMTFLRTSWRTWMQSPSFYPFNQSGRSGKATRLENWTYLKSLRSSCKGIFLNWLLLIITDNYWTEELNTSLIGARGYLGIIAKLIKKITTLRGVERP